MKLSLVLAGLLVVLVAAVSCAPASSSDDLSPLNENEDDERSDRDKRKIGIVKLGVSNGIINFVFGKLDAFLEAKTKALSVLDEGNKAKNAAFEIDPSRSATSEFISKFLAQKAKATSGSVGPLLNAGTTFLSSATQGIAGAFASKFAPLSSLSGGLAGGLSGGSGNGGEDGSSGGDGASGGGGGSGSSNSGSFLTGILGSLSGPGGLSGLSGGSSGGGGGGGANSDEDNGVGVSLDPLPDDFPSNTATSSASAGFGNSAAGKKVKVRSSTPKVRTTTEEDIPEFNRNKVSLDIPSQAFGSGFTLITNISKIISNLIMNSAKRTARIAEIFKPLFRGVLSVKGLPSDNEI